MSENKRYYWLKLDESFFEDDTILWLEEQKNGKDYVIFYLKLMLKSLQDDGSLIRYVGEKLIPYDVPALAKLTNTNEDTVAVAMQAFVDIGLVERFETGEIYMTQINEMIGSETDSARRMRKKRLIDGKKQELLTSPSQSDNDVQISDTEIELDIEKELDKDIKSGESKKKEKSDSAKAEQIPYKDIIDYFNEKTDKSIRHTARGNRKLVSARWNEGYKLEDFKKVIDNKVDEWLGKGIKFSNGKDAETYLHPTTLFNGDNFDKYLNQSNGNDNGGKSYGGLEF